MPHYMDIVEVTNKILSQYDFPLTLRQIYYRLVAAGMIPNRRTAYNQLSKTLVKAREREDVDDTRIEDRAREVLEGLRGYESPEIFVEAIKRSVSEMGSHYSRDLWADQNLFVEVWVEKDALSRVIARAADPYRVTVCPSRGYSSYTYIKRMAVEDRFNGIDKPIIILDFRDHDPSGIQMTEDLQNRFNKYGRGHDITVNRIALTIDQVRKHKLIPNPTKKADPRSAEYMAEYGDECWELDAIEPKDLQRMVTDAIEEQLDLDAWEESERTEEVEKEKLMRRFQKAKVEV